MLDDDLLLRHNFFRPFTLTSDVAPFALSSWSTTPDESAEKRLAGVVEGSDPRPSSIDDIDELDRGGS